MRRRTNEGFANFLGVVVHRCTNRTIRCLCARKPTLVTATANACSISSEGSLCAPPQN